ncbi:MAG: hypothetical protein LAN84_06980 [Acidobacteriia bacterium]|nr:hypothetical protein [Terriglobia bacterium]
MAVPPKHLLRPMGPLRVTRGFLLLVACALALPAAADEIRLKDGKKLYGVIVAYEDNMFKVKTDYGFVLVEKNKISAIIPSAPAPPKPAEKPAAKKEEPPEPPKPAPETPKAASKTEPPAKPAPAPAKSGKAAEKPAASTTAAAAPPAAKPAEPPAAPPPESGPPPNREEVQGNTYINYTYSFRMFKAPSWNLQDEARRALPNAITALGTSNESTLLVIGIEKSKEPLDAAAASIERRLQDAYTNYRRLQQKKTQVGGLPAVEYHYRGTEGEHDWSGRLVVIARGKDYFTILGMTYADSDLIQIQENVIARAIASLDFTAH